MDVVVEASESSPIRDLEAELGRLQPAPGPLMFRGRPFPEGEVSDLRLRDGDVVAVGAPAVPDATPTASSEIRVVGGPAAGLGLRVAPGEYLIGRRSGCDLRIKDPEVSGHHARLVVSADRILIEDLGSSNGTLRNGEPVSGPVDLDQGDVVQVGSSLLELTAALEASEPLVEGQGGSLGFYRRFRTGIASLPEVIDFPVRKEPSEPPALNLVLTIAPSLAMGGIAALTGRPEFLLFVAVSPVIGVGRAIAQRKAHVRRTEKEARAFAEAHDASEARLAEVVREETRRRREAHPDVARLIAIARRHSRQLWERRANDPDSLELRVGLGDLPASVLARNREEAESRPALWRVPVSLRLREVGGVAIVGDPARCRALARAMLLQAVVLHAPQDVKVAILTGQETEADWSWCRWLPHARWGPGEPYAIVGNDGASRRARLEELRSIVRDRRTRVSERSDAVELPYVVVVYDGFSRPELDTFGEIVRDGPSVGVFALTLDESHVPEGCGAAVLLGTFGDDATVEERGKPTLTNVVVDAAGPQACDSAARCLAPITLLADDTKSEIPQTARLLDVLRLSQPSGRDLAERWTERSPRSSGTVGVSDSGALSIDLATDGPHALVAGTTRAGKSEFLKTLVAGLAADNHPDDLSFVFIDFKGGGDYQTAIRLPHAVALSTNQDPTEFERNIVLLDAEIRRRQRLCSERMTNTIEGYRAALEGGRSGPPMPRLVVIVDEFAELVSSQPEQLDRLVSVARVGAAFGVHLVLATQKPGGVVSGQIEANVGLRICFRVRSTADSHEILGAEDAGHISERHRGRAFMRAHQGPLAEFQCARVGGARPGAREDDAVSATLAPWVTLGHVPAALARGREVPDPETDFWMLAEAIREGARSTGWTASAVPWPPPLPERVSLESLEPATEEGRLLVPIGLRDDPEAQCHRTHPIELGAGHVAIAGSAGSGRTTALRTFAGSLASVATPADVHVYVLDFAGGALRPLRTLPHCGGVAHDDLELASRMVGELTRWIRERQDLFAESGWSTIAEQRAEAPAAGRLPYLVLLIDGWDVLNEVGAKTGLPDQIVQLLAQGLSAGLHAVVAGDRTVTSGRLGRQLAHRLALRFNDATDYASVGVHSRDVPQRQVNGRAIDPGTGLEVHVASLAGAGQSEAEALRALAETLRAGEAPGDRGPHRIAPLPTKISAREVRASGARPDGAELPILVGLSGDTFKPAWVDLAESGGVFFVAGPPESGRSTALASIVAEALRDGAPVLALLPKPKDSPLAAFRGLPGFAVLSGPEARNPRPEDVAAEGPLLVVVDDAELVDNQHQALLAMAAGNGPGRAIIVAAGTEALTNQMSGLLATVKKPKTGLLLCPRTKYDGAAFGTSLPDRLVFDGPRGRAVLGRAGRLELVQIGLPDLPATP